MQKQSKSFLIIHIPIYIFIFISIYLYFYIYLYIIYVFTTDKFFGVAIESLPQCDLNPQLLNSVQMLLPTDLSGHEFNSHSEPTLYSYLNFIVCSVSHYIYTYIFDQFEKNSKMRNVTMKCQFLLLSENLLLKVRNIYVYIYIYIYIYRYIDI